MSVATLQQFGQSLPSWVALVQRGETVAIMDGGREVARLVPPEAAQTKPAAAPVKTLDAEATEAVADELKNDLEDADALLGEESLPAPVRAKMKLIRERIMRAGMIRRLIAGLSAKNAAAPAAQASRLHDQLEAKLAGMTLEQLQARRVVVEKEIGELVHKVPHSFDAPGTTTPEAKETQE